MNTKKGGHSPPSHYITRSIFILPMCQNRHTSSYCDVIIVYAKITCLSTENIYKKHVQQAEKVSDSIQMHNPDNRLEY